MTTTTNLYEQFRKNIEKYKLIEKNDTIIIAASGGPDSMTLAYLFNKIKDEYKLNIILAHLNHLHRDEAIYDENLVIETSNRYGLESRVKHASMDDYAKENKISPEDAGRRLRYEFFDEIAKDFDNPKIALAHIKDDQAETVLMRMIRGTGLNGLTAMGFKSKNLIRPLLNISKSEIIDYCHKNDIAYATDQTNLESIYTRNYIRNKIIPLMEDINPSAIDNIFSMTELLADDLMIVEDAIDLSFDKILVDSSNDFIKFERRGFENLPAPYKSRVLIKAIRIIKYTYKDFSKDNIDNFLSLVDLDTGKKIIKDDLEFVKNYKTYSLTLKSDKPISNDSLKINLDEEINFNSFKIYASLVKGKDKANKDTAYFDYDKLKLPLKVRTRKNGDKFSPLGTNYHKKIKDYFIDEKVDRNHRDMIPLILSDDEIIWIAGFRQANTANVDKNTKRILKIEVTNA